MLRFIVLGQIPGTQVQLNFMPLVLLGLIGLLIFEMFLNNRRKQLLNAMAEVNAAAPEKKTRRKSPRKTTKKPTAKRKTTKSSTKTKKKIKQTKLDAVSI